MEIWDHRLLIKLDNGASGYLYYSYDGSGNMLLSTRANSRYWRSEYGIRDCTPYERPEFLALIRHDAKLYRFVKRWVEDLKRYERMVR